MNKMLLDGPKGKVVLCVLEPGNIKLLREGKPIDFSLNDLFGGGGLPAKLNIGIMYSETPIKDANALREMIREGGNLIDARNEKLQTSRPHCPGCESTIEQLGVWQSETPIWLVFCTQCGYTLGTMPPGQYGITVGPSRMESEGQS